MSVDTRSLCRVVCTSAAVTTALQAATGVVAVRRGRRDYADAVWGPGLAAIALAGAAVGNGDPWRRWALAMTTTACQERPGGAGMKALTFHGRRDVRVDEVPDPRLQQPTDATIKVTASAICDRTCIGPFLSKGDVLGHEAMGIVEEVGPR